MSFIPQNPVSTTESDDSAVCEPKRSRVGVKWLVGIAGVSTAAAALIVTSVASTSAEAPVLADDAHVVQAANKVEKKPAAKTKATKKADDYNSETQSDPVYYQPVRQSNPVTTTSDNKQSAQEPKYGKNADADAKVPSKAKKPSSKQNMTEGKPPAGVPIEGPINHAE